MKKIKAVIKDKVIIVLASIFFITAIITILSTLNYNKTREFYPEKVIAYPSGDVVAHHDEITIFDTVKPTTEHTFFYKYEWNGASYEISRKTGILKNIVLFINPEYPEEAIEPPLSPWYYIITMAFFLLILIFRVIRVLTDYLPEEKGPTIEEVEKEVSKLENQSMIAEKQTKKLENMSSQTTV